MATEIMEGYVQISERGLSAVQRMIAGVARTASNAVTGPMRALQSGINGLGSIGMASIGAQALGSALDQLNPVGLIKLAADAEQLQIAFTVMLGSGERAKQLIDDLNEFANVTPFENDGVNQAARTLMAMGVAVDEVIPTLTSLGDVASGVGMPLTDIAMVFGQVKAAGRLMTQDMNQLLTRGIPVIDELAKHFGKPSSEIKKMVEEGKVGFGDLQQIMLNMSSGSGRFSGMMAQQSQTIGGLWSSIVGQAGLAGMQIGQELVDALDLRNRMEQLSGSIGGFLPGLKASLQPIVPLVKSVGDSIFGAFEWIGANGPSIVMTVSDIAMFFGRGAASVKELYDGIYNYLIPGIGGVGGAFMSATDYVGYFFRNSDLLIAIGAEKLLVFATNIPEYIKTGFINGYTWVEWFFENFSSIMSTIGNYAQTVFMNLLGNLKSLFTSLWNWVKSGFKGEFQVDWKPLTDGFKSEIKEWPSLIESELNQTSPVLDELNDELGRREKDRANLMNGSKSPIQKAVESATAPTNQMKIEQAAASVAAKGTKASSADSDSSAKRYGSAEAFSRIMANIDRKDTMKHEKLLKAQLEEAKKTNRHLDNGGFGGGVEIVAGVA